MKMLVPVYYQGARMYKWVEKTPISQDEYI